jgi:hypothetical protein
VRIVRKLRGRRGRGSAISGASISGHAIKERLKYGRRSLAENLPFMSSRTMNHSLTHYLSDHFPELVEPPYQTTFERIGFVLVAAMLGGLLIGAVAFITFWLV